ncbi:MAG: helix-turn-helix domain-containing protein [Actinomycetota bacterium]
MPSTKSYRALHERVVARPGAVERLVSLRRETLGEIGLFELRRRLERSQTDIAGDLGVTQSAVSQFERAEDVRLSTLRNYLAELGADLEVLAVFDNGDDRWTVPLRIGDPATP